MIDKHISSSFQLVKVVLIDFDGTLVDNIPALFQVYCRFLEKRGHTGTSEEFTALNGATIPEIASHLQSTYQINEDLEQLQQEYQERVEKLYTDALCLAPGAFSFLRYARSLGLKLGIVSSAPAELIHAFLEKNELQRYFDQVVSALEMQQGKPHPEVYRKALSLFGMQPEEAIACEDSPHGIHAALAAGIFTFMFVEGKGGNDKSVAVGNWHELFELFQSTFSPGEEA